MNRFEKLYEELIKKYGKPRGQWLLWCKRRKKEKEREEVVIGSVLTQRTNWNNVELAFRNLKKAGVKSLKDILKTPPQKLEELIKPAGFYRAKSQYLIGLAQFILQNYGGLLQMKKVAEKKLREELLKLKGVGPETTDSILLYALDKPIFVIDEYTRRLVKERALAKDFSYGFLQNLFEKNLEKDFKLYQDFHALIVIECKKKSFAKRI
jgi:endonuclease-3 related protein